MSRKAFVISAIIIVVIAVVGAVGLKAISGLVKGDGAVKQRDSGTIVGDWQEDSTGVEVSFRENGSVEIAGENAAVYTIDEKNAQITVIYSQVYGGDQVVFTYDVTDTQLTLTSTTSKEMQTYTKITQ